MVCKFRTEVPFRHTLRWKWNHYPQIGFDISVLKSFLNSSSSSSASYRFALIYAYMQPESLRCLNIEAALWGQTTRKIMFLNQESAFISLYSQQSNFKAL